MKHSFLRWATKLNSDAKRRRGWRRAVRIMTMIVVFCTTYALILPAITWEEAPVCGLEEHIHGPDCYEAVEAEVVAAEEVVEAEPVEEADAADEAPTEEQAD